MWIRVIDTSVADQFLLFFLSSFHFIQHTYLAHAHTESVSRRYGKINNSVLPLSSIFPTPRGAARVTTLSPLRIYCIGIQRLAEMAHAYFWNSASLLPIQTTVVGQLRTLWLNNIWHL